MTTPSRGLVAPVEQRAAYERPPGGTKTLSVARTGGWLEGLSVTRLDSRSGRSEPGKDHKEKVRGLQDQATGVLNKKVNPKSVQSPARMNICRLGSDSIK